MSIQIIRKDVLDHGYVEVVESWGSDECIIESARMSTQKGFLGWRKCAACGEFDGAPGTCAQHSAGLHFNEPADEKLLRFLYEHKHSTPFEFAGLTIEVQAPIFVFREWHRHRVPFGYTEASARYAPLPDVNYVPTVERLMMGTDGKNKQAGTVGGAAVLTRSMANVFRATLEAQYRDAQANYDMALEAGVPKELARIGLPVGRYSKMRATGNLRGWLGFLTLRMDPAAQYEIRQYANAVGDIIADRFPRTWELFVEGRIEGRKS